MKYHQFSIHGKHALVAALQSPRVAIKTIQGTERAITELAQDFPEVLSISKKCRPQDLPQDRRHQGLIADISFRCFSSWAQWEEQRETEPHTVLILDHLQDPQNLGNALRHAHAFGVSLVVLPEHEAAPLNGTVAMASTGSLFALPILQVSSLLQCVALLKKQGFGVLGTALTQEAQPFSSEMFWPKSAIIVGAEGSGMKAGLIKACDTLLTIPMAQGVQSLNAATTAAIICYERYKQMSLLLRN